MNWAIAYNIAKFIIWLVLNIKDLVVEAEERLPEPGKGSEKFSAVVTAIRATAKIMGLVDTAIDAVFDTVEVEKKINDTVAKEINGKQ